MAPADLVAIATACNASSRVSIAGVVVDAMGITNSRGSSKITSFELKDDQFDLPAWSGSLKVKFFKNNENHMPHAQVDDVILIRNIKISDYYKSRGTVCAVASQAENVPWMIFRAQEDASRSPNIIQGPDEFTPTLVENRKVHDLLDHVQSNKQAMAPQQKQRAGRTGQSSTVVEASLPTPKKYRLRLIKDVECDVFCELVVQVVKKHFHHYDGDKCTLWVTDYTSHELLPDREKDNNTDGTEGDKYGHLPRKENDWPGPWGKQTLQVTLYEPHASYGQDKVQINDIVHLSYVRPKTSRNADLEAMISEDRKFPDRVHLKIVSPDYDVHAQELMKRRKEYWSIHGERKENSKPAKKKKTQEPKKTQRTEENQTSMRPPMPTTSSRAKNPKVKIRNYGIPNSSIDDILLAKTHIISLPGDLEYQVPFQNVGYTLTGRVVDFYPPKLEDFAQLVRSDSLIDGNESWRWEWRFCLLVEGVEPLMSKTQRRERVKIFVAGGEAEHLLDLIATDLRQDLDRQNDLREKLFLLWGNLEEVKQANENKARQDQAKELAKHSSLPFECSIREYGVPCLHSQNTNAMAVDGELCVEEGCFGWERRFSLYGTTIQAN